MTQPSGFRVADADRVARVLDHLAWAVHLFHQSDLRHEDDKA